MKQVIEHGLNPKVLGGIAIGIVFLLFILLVLSRNGII